MTSLPLLINKESNKYDVILGTVNCLTKMVYYKPIKTTIDVINLVEIITDMIIRHHDFSKSTIND